MDKIFKALNDPTRRNLLDELRRKDGQTLSDLEERLEMSRFGVMKHLGVLEDASLITTRKEGRFKYHYLNALPLQEVIDRWIEPLLAKPKAKALSRLKAQLEGPQDMTEKPDLVMQTFIRCTQDALWQALTKSDEIMNYHFIATSGTGQLSAPDDRMAFMAPDGSEMVAHRLISSDPQSRIEVTFEPNWDEVKTHSRCVYLIEPNGAFCKLTVEHYGVPPEHPGVSEGWARTFAGLKTWLETGEPARFGYQMEDA